MSLKITRSSEKSLGVAPVGSPCRRLWSGLWKLWGAVRKNIISDRL